MRRRHFGIFRKVWKRMLGPVGLFHRLTYWTVFAIVMVTLWRGIVQRLARLFYVIDKLWRSFLESWCVGTMLSSMRYVLCVKVQ